MNKLIVIPIAASIFLLIDFYVWQAVKTVSNSGEISTKNIVRYVYWGLTALSVGGFLAYHFLPIQWLGRLVRQFILVGLFINYFSKIVVILFLLIDDFGRIVRWVFSFFLKPSTANLTTEIIPDDAISRSDFLMKTALAVGTVPAVAMTWGIVSGAHDYRIVRVPIRLKNLPKQFDGMTIGQISDIHSGSFFNKTAVKGGVDMLLAQKPDTIFFTGDLVNNTTDEVNDYYDIFKHVKAPLGVFSILGNHDYGDYHEWKSIEAKKQNLRALKEAHRLLGWDLILDDARQIMIEKEPITLIGVENWGVKFQKYGHLDQAYKRAKDADIKLLLSHDPTHWDAQVRPTYKDIDITFSGHTHGTQFGVKLGEKTWSPAQYIYKQWAGLYQENNQYLYVNRGYGYLGFPGRVGMPPEITIFELKQG